MILKIFLLDGASALIIVLPFFFFVHMGTTVWIEGYILRRYGYKLYGQNTRASLIANLASLVIGLCLLRTIKMATPLVKIPIDPLLISLFLYFVPTLIVEWVVLKLLNYYFSPKKLTSAVLLMNSITYVNLYFILKLIHYVEANE
ncbi:MAG TPA: hypothetical protein VF008_08365 [Niastella sp.]